MKILVLGASGFIGQRLQEILKECGHQVLTGSLRKRGDNWEGAVASCDAVVNLVGEPLFGRRWNTNVKAAIYDSRVEGTERVVSVMGRALEAGGRCRVLVNGSAVGFYGNAGEVELPEGSPNGAGFLARVCRDWEEQAWRAQSAFGIRTVALRTGVVLGKNGGALSKLLPPFRLGLGGPIGLTTGGRQWFPWIHLDDIVGLIMHALESEAVHGPLNGAAPTPVRNREFAATLGKVLRRPAFFPLPAPALYALVGEAQSVLTAGQKVVPAKALATGYRFKFPELEGALRDILG